MNASEIWVYAEQRYGILQPASLEALGEASRIGRITGAPVSAVLLGQSVMGLVQPLAEYGARKVYVVEHPLLRSFTIRPYAHVLTSLIQEHAPSLILFSATCLAADLAPRIAARLGSPMAGNCVSVEVDGSGQYIMTRPAYGGQFHAKVVPKANRPVIATLRRGSSAANSRDPRRRAEVVTGTLGPVWSETCTKVIRLIRPDPRDLDVSEAEIVVSGGRGAGTRRGFQLIEALADALGGSVAGTRPAVDAGWIPNQRLVGQTGKIVSPKLYIACGISGMAHHVAGMKDSRLILAINNDACAPIFRLADLGLVGDLYEIVPELTRQIQGARQNMLRSAGHPESGGGA